MSWLWNTTLSLARQLPRFDPRTHYDPQACYISFCTHWQQAYNIIEKYEPPNIHDGHVWGVIYQLEQISNLLLLEARAKELNPNLDRGPVSCLEYLLIENLLNKLYEWAGSTGRYENALRLEQLKLYENLVAHYSPQVIAAEPFIRPLLKLLSDFRNELTSEDVRSQLVIVLNQLCVTLMQNMKLIDLFFLTTHTQQGSESEFIIVRLLLESVHSERRTGSTARDALLLCAKMSAHCEQLADYMLNRSNTCLVLATGLGGHYSSLPCTLGEKVHRLTPDDVNQIDKLTFFIDSLEFCNAVAQVAHPLIKERLLDLLYQGFLVPIMGPALLQSGAPEQAAAMVYLELMLRCVTPHGLLRTILKFLMQYKYDGIRVLDVLLRRLEGDSQLSLVTLGLMETLVDLNCEDVMLELIYKYLLNGHYLMVSHRTRISDSEPYREASVAFLSLRPRCCWRSLNNTREWAEDFTLHGKKILSIKASEETDGRGLSNSLAEQNIAMSDLVQEIKFNYGNPNESLIGNYHAYLCDVRFEIVARDIACMKWSSKYDTINKLKRNGVHGAEKTDIKEQDSLVSVCTSGYETLKNDSPNSDSSGKEHDSLTSLNDETNLCEKANVNDQNPGSSTKDDNVSIGESSGYDSFKYKCDDDDHEMYAEESFWKMSIKTETNVIHCERDIYMEKTWKATAEYTIGPLLSSLLKKTATILESDLTRNLSATSMISKLASFPTPLLCSLLLCPGFVLQPSVPSLFQILSKLKNEVDELTNGITNVNEFVDKARVFLIQRELALVKPRSQSTEESQDATLLRAEDTSFRRAEPKRNSLSTKMASMFGRRLSHGLPAQNQYVQPTLNFTQEAYWNQSVTHRSILNAVILDEWVKELAALAEEHALRLSASYVDDAYYDAVSL